MKVTTQYLPCAWKKVIWIPVRHKHGLPCWKIKSCAEAAKYLHLRERGQNQ